MRQAKLPDVIAQMRHFPEHRPGFSIFLGAGASKSSGVPLAEDMAFLAFKERFESEDSPMAKDLTEDEKRRAIQVWVRSQPWYDRTISNYQLAMENALLFPGVREAFLRKHTFTTRVSPGYRRLAQLLRERIVDTVYTTNFDDLVRRGCEGVLNPPLVEVSSLEQYPKQEPSPTLPRQIRLHGDFWHENLLNTEGEFEEIPKVRFETVHRLSRPQGMIVMGYGGGDRRIMIDLFQKGLSDKSFLANGLFWCTKRDAEIPQYVATLAADGGDRVRIVEIDGFDEVMELLARRFELPADPLVVAESLRSSNEAQALLTNASSIFLESKNLEYEAMSGRISDALTTLTGQLGASLAFLVAFELDSALVISGTNVRLLGRLSTSALSLLFPDGTPRECAFSDLSLDDVIMPPPAAARIIAYPIFRGSEALGVTCFGYERSALTGGDELGIVSSVTALLLLAFRTRISEEVSKLAYQRWEQLGRRPDTSDDDWFWAKEQIRNRLQERRYRSLDLAPSLT